MQSSIKDSTLIHTEKVPQDDKWSLAKVVVRHILLLEYWDREGHMRRQVWRPSMERHFI